MWYNFKHHYIEVYVDHPFLAAIKMTWGYLWYFLIVRELFADIQKINYIFLQLLAQQLPYSELFE